MYALNRLETANLSIFDFDNLALDNVQKATAAGLTLSLAPELPNNMVGPEDNINGTSGDETLNGTAGDDIIDGNGGTDTINAGAGNDIIIFDFDEGPFNGNYNGDSGTDSILLRGVGDFHADSSLNDFISIEEIEFEFDNADTGTRTLFLNAEEMDGAELSSTLLIDGADGSTTDLIVITMGNSVTTLDISGWTFQDWNNLEDETITINGDADDETITGSSQDDIINAGGGDNIINAGGGNDIFIESSLSTSEDNVDMGSGDDTVFINSAAVGLESFDGGSGIDTFDISGIGNFGGTVFIIDLAAGEYSFDSAGGNHDDVLNFENVVGSVNADMITGDGGINVIDGGGGDDVLTGGGGADTINGGSGDDRFVFENGWGTDILDGGADSDTVDFSLVAGFDLRLEVLNGYTSADGSIVFQAWQNMENIIGSQGNDMIIGDNSDNILDGGAGDDTISGGDGFDTLIGGLGIDTLDYTYTNDDMEIDFGGGTARLVGGAFGETFTGFENLVMGGGNDIILGEDFMDGDIDAGGGDDLVAATDFGNFGETFDGGTGTDTIAFTITNGGVTFDLSTGMFDGDIILNFENVTGGTGDDTLTGDNNDNVINGGGGDDIIDGSTGNDTVNGGAGNDLFVQLDLGDIDTLDGGTGTDTISTATSGSNWTINLLAGTGSTISSSLIISNLENITAGVGHDTLFGSNVANEIFGGAGDDIISGLDGNDRLFGENGNDRLNGGTGNDLLSGGAGDDVFIGGAGNDNHLGSGGFDTMDYSASASRVVLNLITGGTLGDAAGDSYNGIEEVIGSDFNDDITGGTASDTIFGGAGNDRLFGSGGFDVLDGGDGDDLLSGGDDADTFIGGAGADVHLGGGGLDIIDYSASASRVVLNLDTSGTLGDALGDTYFGVETVIGTDFNDNITGDSASETLDGGAGNDVLIGAGGYDLLIGGDGDDTMSGGVGHDRFLGGAGADSHNGGANIDTVDYRLATSAVSLSLINGGSAGDALGDTYVNVERVLGSDFNDTIFGSTGNDNLHGYAGDDFMWGGSSGNDVLFGETGNDTFYYSTVTGDGFDTLADFVTGAGSDDVINLYQSDVDFDTFAEVMAVATQVGTSVVFSFGGSNKIRVLNTMIADFHADDFVLTPAPGNGEAVAEAPSVKATQEGFIKSMEAIAAPEVESAYASTGAEDYIDMAGFDVLDALLH